ncbi:hypothetical protein LIZ98_04490 [Caldibacillus sp. 210928-DFI.2.18]|nr:hypothetical protein [Caldibacillus sp. 210928-DFI.2.18]
MAKKKSYPQQKISKNKLSTFFEKNKQNWFFLTLFVNKFNWKILPTVDKS